jgi:hypothetical protein
MLSFRCRRQYLGKIHLLFYLVVVVLALYAVSCISTVADMNSPGSCLPTTPPTPCKTVETCLNDVTVYTNTPDGMSCNQGINAGLCIAGVCELECEKDPQTMCSCTQPEDCPQSTLPECGNAVCNNRTCGLDIKSDVVLVDTNPGNCMKFVCNDEGDPVEIADDTDLPSLMICHMAACNQGVPETPPQVVGTMCGGDMPNPDVCDSTGACVECVNNGDGTSTGCPVQESCYMQGSGQPACTICYNGVLDGDETDVDCGGTATHNKLCPECAKGNACSIKEDCGSGASNCVDGVCCILAACDKCTACNTPWDPGSCSALQVGAKPTDGSMDCLCDGSGSCEMTSKKAFNESCAMNADCYSNVCTNGLCKIPLNGLCSANDDCGSGTCDMMPGPSQFICI